MLEHIEPLASLAGTNQRPEAGYIQRIEALVEVILGVFVACICEDLELHEFLQEYWAVATLTASSLTSGVAGSQLIRRCNLVPYLCSISPRGINVWAIVS